MGGADKFVIVTVVAGVKALKSLAAGRGYPRGGTGIGGQSGTPLSWREGGARRRRRWEGERLHSGRTERRQAVVGYGSRAGRRLLQHQSLAPTLEGFPPEGWGLPANGETSHPPTASRRAPPSLYERRVPCVGLYPRSRMGITPPHAQQNQRPDPTTQRHDPKSTQPPPERRYSSPRPAPGEAVQLAT